MGPALLTANHHLIAQFSLWSCKETWNYPQEDMAPIGT